MNTDDFPETLFDTIRHFSDPQVSFDFMVQLRWPDGVVKCPRCESTILSFISTRKTWECKCCTEKKQFSVKTGTIFEESPLTLDKWLGTIWLIANAKNGISSYEVHRAIGVTQKTGWFMLQRIRLAMRTGTFEKIKGEVEVDETLVGGKMKNMHGSRKKRAADKKGSFGKSVVLGIMGRSGEVRAMQIPDNKMGTLETKVREHVEFGSEVFTDALPSYYRLDQDYIHEVIDHAVAYVNGKIHTNGIENFWSLLKRTLKGTYVSVDPAHLFRYLDEQVFRYNRRKVDDSTRFLLVAAAAIGKRITYKTLTAHSTPA